MPDIVFSLLYMLHLFNPLSDPGLYAIISVHFTEGETEAWGYIILNYLRLRS